MGKVWEGKVVIWNWYGAKFYQIFNYGKLWEENLRQLILWEKYENKVPIHLPEQYEFPKLPLPMALIWDFHSVEYSIDYPYPLTDGQHAP